MKLLLLTLVAAHGVSSFVRADPMPEDFAFSEILVRIQRL
jgi:hypothetical protein